MTTMPAPGSPLDVALANVTAAVIGAVIRGATTEHLSAAANSGIRIATKAARLAEPYRTPAGLAEIARRNREGR